uniref:Protein kinase domain-containing protein n=1 Tax=Hymenolepis diminuta TaxID=6216 RepID=A0A158QEB7_HYMDI
LGVTGLELWEAEPPLAGVPPMKAFSLITHGPHPLSLYPSKPPPDIDVSPDDVLIPVADQMPMGMYDFLTKCLDKDKSRRPSSAELLQHRFLSGVPHSIQKARNHLLNLMRSVNGGGNILNRRFSEPSRYNFSPFKQAVDMSGEKLSGKLDGTVPAALNSENMSTSSSGNSPTPKNLKQRYTSTISLNICSSNTSSPLLNMSPANSTIRSSKTVSKETTESNALTYITTPTTFNGHTSSSSNDSDSMNQQNTLRSTLNSAPTQLSQSAKYMSPIPTNSSAYFSCQLKSGNSTVGEVEKVISTNRNDSCPIIVREIEEEEDQCSDIDMESSGEYEKEEVSVIEKVKEPTQVKERNGSFVEVPKMNLETEGCITDVNGIIVYTPSTSEYRNLFQSNQDDLKHFIKRLLQQVQNEYNDQIVFVVGKPQEPTFRLCKLIYDEIPCVLTATKELINNAFLISEKLIGRQELSIRGMGFVFSRDLRLIDASMDTFLNANASTRKIFKNPLFRAFNGYVTSKSSEVSPTKDLSEIVQFQLLIMSAGFSPQEIVGLYRLMIAMSAIRFIRKIKRRHSPCYGRLSYLPEDLYSCIQKRILHGEVVSPYPLTDFTPNDVARLIGVDEKAFNNLVYSKSLRGDHARRNIVSKQFWRYLNFRKSKLLSTSGTAYSQNDSGFFEDYSGSRKRWIKIRRPVQPIRIRKCYFRKVTRTRKHLDIYHRVTLKHVYRPRRQSGIRPHQTVVEMLCRKLHILCVSVVFNKLNSMLHSSLNNFIFLGIFQSYFSEEKDKLKLDNFYQQQSKRLLEQLLQSPTSGYLPCLAIQDVNTFEKFKPSFIFQNFDEIIPHIVNTNATVKLMSVLDDGRSSSLDLHPQNITLPLLSPPLSGNLTLQRHLRVFQDSGLLNFAAINTEASGLTVMKSDEFLRRFSVLNPLQSDEGKSLKSLARKLGMGAKLPSAVNSWKGLKMLPLSRNYFSASIVKIMENCGLLNGLYFVSTDLILLSTSAMNHLKLELLKRSISSRCIQRWWRQHCQQRQRLQDISNFLFTTSVTSMNSSSNNYTTTATPSNPIKDIIFPEVNDTKSILEDDRDAACAPVYVVANTVLSNVPVPQSYNLQPQQISPQPISPTSQKANKNSKRPPPSSGIAWFEPRHQRPPAFPSVALKPERIVSFVENPAPRYLGRNQSVSAPHNNEPQETNLRRSSSVRAFDFRQHNAYIPDAPPIVLTTSKDSRPLARSNSSNIGCNVCRENLGGVQRRVRRRTTEMPTDLGERRPVSWHVDQMEAQVIAHMEKQKVLNGEGSPILLRRRNSFAKVPAGDQRRRSISFDYGKYQYAEVETDANPQQPPSSTCKNEEEDNNEKQGTYESRHRDIRRVTSELSQSRSPYRRSGGNDIAASLAAPRSPSQSAKSPESQREEFLRVQSEIMRGEYRRSRELTTSPPRQNNYPVRREITPDTQQNYQSLSSHPSRSFDNTTPYGSIPDFRLLYSNDSNYPQAQPYFTRPNRTEMRNVAASKQPHGFPPNIIPKPPLHNSPRRRPVTTVFDGPLTPNIFPINLPFRNHSPSREPMRQPRMTFVTSPMDGKVIIPVNGRKSSLPAMPISARLPVNACDVDSRSLKAIGGGCVRNFCYD